MRALWIFTVLAVLAVPTTAEASDATMVVDKGDTLTSIAKRHGTTVADLRRWNDLPNDVIQLGQTLRVKPLTRTRAVRAGETLGVIAKREGTSVAEIVKLNPGLKPNRIAAGQQLELPPLPEPPKPAPDPEPPKPECPGKVVQLTGHSNYSLRSKHVAWATAQTAHAMQRGFDHVRRTQPRAPRVRVLDASRREGGQLGEHRSHRDFRDVDITYFQKSCEAAGCPLRNVKPAELDVATQWALLSYWLEREDVEYLFVDHALQKVLYEHAKSRGVSREKLDEWFQYPLGDGARAGRIRHWEGHENHLHVRFWPAESRDESCTSDKRSAAR